MSKPSAPPDRSDRTLFPVDHAFVVALRCDSDVEGGHWAGRIEHMSSGQVGNFGSMAELARVVRGFLADNATLTGPGTPQTAGSARPQTQRNDRRVK